MQNNQPALRVFACMKTRVDGRPSCGARGASELILALRNEIESRSLSAAHMDVRPAGCLDRCESGPILLGFTGPITEQPLPPAKLPESLLRQPAASFEHVSVEQISAIVDKLLGLKS